MSNEGPFAGGSAQSSYGGSQGGSGYGQQEQASGYGGSSGGYSDDAPVIPVIIIQKVSSHCATGGKSGRSQMVEVK